MEPEILRTATDQTLSNQISFEDMCDKFLRAGIESAHVDLFAKRITFHTPEAHVYEESFYFEGPRVADIFSEEKIILDFKSLLLRKLSLHEFFNFIMLAGVTGFTIYLLGKKVLFFGRRGEYHLEYLHREK
ncbi:hypothetical protein [Bdellovibrio sp. NC01]|uniref:hypothetical protein n=1 Tax=Bdellovibrio sp. NC01 TaxID=2220073 RepID=UPI00115C099C|nr:hypothetical protein [Bdellovibrio sp. NC01]QDK36356.1 hypothetical protein DOE51_01445 [Bdellovibrio sp. NC01]